MKCAVLLSGCGPLDGSEIHETVFCLYSLEKKGIEAVPLSLDEKQTKVMSHIKDSSLKESRNMMVESARISRGLVHNLSDYDYSKLDMLVLPGGFGAALNFSDFASEGSGMSVNSEVDLIISDFYRRKKPIGVMCIAPVLVAKTLGEHKPLLTVGDNKEIEDCLESFGARVEKCPEGGVVVDRENRIVSTPAYMYESTSLVAVAEGADKMVEALLRPF